jgi:PAS domain S-box-containing protein
LARLIGARHPADLAGHAAAEFLNAGSLAPFEALERGEKPTIAELTLLGAQGEWIDVQVTSTLTLFDGEQMSLSFFQDITEQRRAEAALRQTDRRYRRLSEGSMIGFMEVDEEWILDANDVLLRTIGRSRQELERGELRWQEITPAEYRPLDEEMIWKLLTKGECEPFEKELLRPDGSRVLVLLGCSLLSLEPKPRAICFTIDLTDRRRLQEMRAEKLRAESVAALAAGMAHTLNNLLTAIMGNASLLVEGDAPPSAARQLEIAGEIIASGGQAADLTAQLLAYSGQGRHVLAAVDVGEVIANEAGQMAWHPGFRCEAPRDLPLVRADADDLRRLAHGLVTNAIEAVGDRLDAEVVLRAYVDHAEEGALLSRLGEPMPAGEYCVIEVRDNGPGMDANTLAHAFDPFFSTKFPGRGLGLPAAAGMVRSAGGAIRVSTAPGRGCVFLVYLRTIRTG